MSVTIQTKITGDKEVMAKLEVLAKKNIEALKKVLTKSTLVIEARAKKKAPVVFNRLASSITSEVKKSGSGYIGRTGTNSKYASHVEFGSRPHLAPISAEYARKYGFDVPAGADYIMLRVSGKAQPFLYPAFKESQGDIKSFVEQGIKGIRL